MQYPPTESGNAVYTSLMGAPLLFRDSPLIVMESRKGTVTAFQS